MKKFFIHFIFLVIVFLINLTSVGAQTVNENIILTWPFGLGTADQTATITPTVAEGYFSTNWTSLGSNLKYVDFRTSNSVTFTRFQPFIQNNSVTENDYVAFSFRPKTGLKFKPTSVSFDCQRYGTDGGKIDVVWKSTDGTLTTIATGIVPARDNSLTVTHASYDLSAITIPESAGDCGLYVYIYSLGNTKQVGLANILINGNVQGTIQDIVTHTFAASVFPENAGTVSNIPTGTTFDQGTEISLMASRNFGYKFKEWRNSANDSLISSENPTKIILSSDLTIKAVFEQINTYSLKINLQGGAAPYMVSASPAGTVVGGQTVYEEGVNVTLTASNNDILTFTNWLSGETNAILTLPMTQNQEVTAMYTAVDYIVGWDFYKSGNSSRPADFFSTIDNETANLILRKEDGTLNSWLDKSIVSANGYYVRGAAVNWKPIADKYYYQIHFNAKDFTDINVTAGMLFNYNAYSVQKCEYSLDNINFTTLGTYSLTAAQTWYDQTFNLPTDANHAETVYVRWIPDYTSALIGTEALNNDGTSISNIYVKAKAAVLNDGVAPALSSSVPANGSTGASASGKIVLTFDERVMLVSSNIKAVLGGRELTPVVSGNTITFAYMGLDYNTQYIFNFPANSVSDLTGNVLSTDVGISFTTMSRPTVSKKEFDFVVGVDGDFKAAIAAATAASSTGERFRIFFPDGQYDIGTNTGDVNQKTSISLPNISYIGQSAENVVLFNKSTIEGIGGTATIYFNNSASNIYMQDMTLMNKMDFRTGTLLGRAVALQDYGNKNIYKNVNLLSNQDTYYSGNGRQYFEGGSIHGTVDFICGGGDVFFNECLLYLEERAGNCITAPSTSSNWGYVFSNCTIDGFSINNGSYKLGRPWQNSPRAVYINTRMNVLPTAEGWTEMGVVPALFAEYNSVTSSGTIVDLSNRKKIYTYNGVSTEVNPYLTAEQAAQYTVENVLGGTDTWQPKLYTDQALVPTITGERDTIYWDDNNYVLCWAVFKDNKFVKFVTTNRYEIPVTATSGVYTVRAANEMGGLSIDSNPYQYVSTGTGELKNNIELIKRDFYDISGKQILKLQDYKGVIIIRSRYSDGSVISEKIIKATKD